MRFFLPLLITAVLLATVGLAALKGKTGADSFQSAPGQKLTIASPSPFPFDDLTIPYLRSREYKSSLDKLDKISENSKYTSYLTSYTSDGLKINGLLTIPAGEAPSGGWPAIVFVHGYIPPTLYKTTEKYTEHVDYLARNGFVVFKIDLRGNGNSQGEAGGAYYSGDYVIDTLNAHTALQGADFVNAVKVGLWGHSMAGNVVFRAFAAKPEIPAVAIWAGAVYSYEDLQKYGLNDNSYRPPGENTQRQKKRQELFNKYGQFDKSSDFWKQVAAVNYISDLKGAIQVHHAVDDTVVNIAYSRDLVELLDESSIAHELFEYPSGGHNLTGGSFSLAMQRTVEFYKKYLVK